MSHVFFDMQSVCRGYNNTMIKTVQEILDLPPTKYTGSEKTKERIKEQIVKRFGKKAGERYNPTLNCRTYAQWLSLGYKVKEGETALQSITFIEKRNGAGLVTERYPRVVNLFYILQVERIHA